MILFPKFSDACQIGMQGLFEPFPISVFHKPLIPAIFF